MSAPPSPELDNLSCHSRQTSQNSDSSAESTASIQSLHLASVPLSSFRTPVSPPSSRSAHSTQTSPISAATSYRVYRRDDNATEHGSNLGAGEVAGLMRTLNLNSSPTIERDLEDGEIRERVPRQRQQSFGGALPSSPEVLPTKNAITTLPTCSTLSTIPSSSSFQSSSSSIPTSVSNSSDMSVSVKVPETGPIDLEALEKDSDALPKFTLNPNAPAHIPSSGDSCTSYDTNDDQFKSPNVYINGLPPHYPEDQLFELCSPFGEIRSVRSFTRHVGEKESGYGFVLFETVEAAEKCIQSLRRFRNLHPTFSKQSHKIPGMPYTQNQPSSSQSHDAWTHEMDNGPSLAQGAYDSDSNHSAVEGGKTMTGESFKAKMERLQDPNSTNLYIEGLPLSIDEPSLSALVSPHRIKSSRFFQTRLSNPPRIIAFVRLETRQGAEEVVERLHGRMVRGWNDPGSRISVRFADTSEQRELRRTERSVRDDSDTTASPSRLTIAQAALLNLRGRDQIRTTGTTLPAPPIGLGRNSAGSAPTANQVYNDFSSNAHDLSSASAGGYRGSASDLTSAAKLLAGIGGANSTLGYVSPYHQASPPPNMLGQNQDLTPAMAALLDSLRGNGAPWVGDHESSRYAPAPHSQRQPQGPLPTLRNAHPVLGDVDLNLAYPATSHYGNGAQGHALPPHQNHVGYGNRLPQQSLSLGGGVAQTRSGYTPAEELILSAHASTMRMGRKGHHGGDQGMGVYHRRGDDHADFNVGVRGYRTQASTMALNPSSSSYHHPSSGNLPVVLESDGADGDYDSKPRGSQQQSRYPQSQLNGRARAAAQTSRMRERERDAGHHQQYEYPSSNGNGLSSSNHNYSSNNNSIGNQQSHVRSTTLPPSSTPSAAAPRHYQHNSMSIPKSRNITNDIMRTTSQTIQPQSQHSKHRSTNSVSSINSDSKNHNNNSNNQHLHLYSDTNDINRTCTLDGGGSTYSDPASHHHHYRHSHNYPNSKAGGDLVLKTKFDDSYDHMVYDVPQTSPPLVSPALTYSSRGSGATLSPSTPYVGFGAAPEAALNGHEKFQGRGMETEVEVGDGR